VSWEGGIRDDLMLRFSLLLQITYRYTNRNRPFAILLLGGELKISSLFIANYKAKGLMVDIIICKT
jgi:hypothetical protein